MAAFLKEIEKFYGTKEKNRQGEDLETFLEHYDPRKYETPSCTTDAVIFSITGELLEVNQLKVLLVRRSNHPSIGFWALPGGFAEMRENLEDTARRELEEETGYRSDSLEWLITLRTTVAFCDEKIEIYVAKNLTAASQHLDEDEYVDVKAYAIEELKEMIFGGTIEDSKTIAAILAYESKYLKQK